MATGGGPFEEGMNDQDLPSWSNESFDDRLNNTDWGGQQKKANRSSEKNKKKFGGEGETRLTNDISPESSPGMGRRKTRTLLSFPHTRYMTQMSVPEQAELERLKQRINFSDLDQRSIGSDSQGRATAANNKRQLNETRKPFNFLPLQINTNKGKDAATSPQKKETGGSSQCKELFASALSKDFLQNYQVSVQEDGRGEPAMDSSQIVSRLVQIRDYIAKASSMRDDLVEKNERSANVERLSHLIDHLKEQEKSYLKFLQKMLARDPQQEAKEELENLKKQHDLLTRMLQQQEQLKALQGRQAALLALQHKAEQAIAVMDDSVVTETTGSISGVSLTSELNEELNELIQRFHNQLHESQTQPVPDNRRQAESLSLTREISQSRNSSMSQHLSDEKAQLFSKMRMLQGKKQKMDKLLGELHTLRDEHLNNSSFLPVSPVSGAPQRSIDQRSTTSAASAPTGIATVVNGESNSLASSAPYPPDSIASQNESEEDDNLNPTEKLQKLNEVRKRLNELRELVHYYEQTSDMMTDAVNENTKEEDTGESECDSEHENSQPVTNIRNPQGISSWGEINSNSNIQCGTTNRDGRHLNTDCEINNRSAANLRTLNMSSTLDCRNRDNDKDIDDISQGGDDEVEEDRASEVSLSSCRSSVADAGDAEFEQKINRLIAAKQKLKQLQNLVAMVQDDETEPEATTADISNAGDFFLAEVEEAKQQPNNIRASTNKLQQDVRLNEKAREKFYEAKLQQQQRELKQLQEERRKLIEIQEKIQALQKACPDLQLSASLGNCQANRPASPATSTPAVESSTAGNPILEPEESVTVDNELWSEMRRHEILREELRQRRKQLEALMAEHQRRRDLAETTSTVAASVKSDGSETQCTPQQSRMEKTVATWGGSTQCVLDEEDGDGYLSDGLVQAEEEEEEQESSSNDNFSMYPHNNDQSTYCVTENKDRWKNRRPLSADGNYRPLAKTRQQQNISMRRQENLKWMSELSYVEEKEQWQEQINQLKKQLEFSVRICQTLMQDQQTLSCLLQTLLTGPYSVMPSNVASPQVHLIMHQLNQCYTQLTWQQNNVQRLKQMLNDLMYQQEQQQQEKPQRKERGSSAPPPPSPTVFCPFSFPPQPMNLFNIPGFTNFSSFAPGMNFNPMFPSGFGDFAHNVTPHNSEQPQQQPLDHTSGKTEYMAFPKPFESSSSVGAEKQRSQRQPEEEMENRAVWLDDSQEGRKEKQPFLKAGFAVSVQNMASGNHKSQSDTSRRRREFDEESLESFSSMPDPVDPTTVTKTFKSRKASAQASLASKDKTPKSKNKRRSSSQLKSRVKNTGYESASISSTWEPCKSNRSRRSVHSEEAVQAKVFSKKNQEQLEKIIKYSRSTEMSSAHARRILQQSNRNACIEAPETGSDLSMFEALRDTIYSEVATLISQNESRPHFLIELFHELQLLNTDYLRQRALYALQDIVTRHISENNEKGECTKSLNSATWMASNSELTPSESLATTDDETFEKNFDTGASRDCEQNDADNGSTMSTSSNFEPFATDDLGNTVIHLDQALARMREYERMKTEAESTLDSEGCCSNLQSASAVKLEGQSTGESPCVPQPSEVSSVPCPRIDTQQLDRQIKAIMKEVIPFLKEHMDEVCSSQLLTSVRRMVLTLTQQNDESKEFVKFFHKQLGGILQDSLAKFAGRKLKDCGEDLLVEISEVLFNELAFFKLMKDLDSNSITVKQRCKSKMEAAGVIQPYDKEAKRVLEVGVRSSAEDIDEDKDKDETETVKPTQESEIYNDGEVPQSMRSDASDQEEDEESEGCPVSISLSKAETQALTNYGSGEDENEDDEIEFEEGPVDVQTSLQASNDTTVENEQGQISTDESDKPNEYEILSSKQKSISSKDEQDVPAVLPHYLNMLENKKLLTVSAPESVSATKVSATEEPSPSLLVNEIQISETMCIETKSLTGSPESSMAGSPDTESPVLVTEYEAGSGNISQKSDEDDFVRVEDLPLKLTIYSEADLMNKMVAEAQTNTLSDAILDGDGMQSEELAGDSQTLKEPETAGAQSA
ncbi:pericentriolar material 1 protein isoform X13 [Chelonia mydas]|uniref:pericentriolar material 1 protein isoform X13 n=1 Tax=Chelonia mydas TaxID=8469 RepID=UPI0018A1CDCC|nr:pericentriolar material 1 protein isoform X13 [Chelonia mydas]XP_043402072.1 pericentriolar material 1 protein isoform X13 [Chelonia mydas]XP_043402073.1 pericentriolar material 1 protein isoform X13 [Chelonia mydas]XP_043402074.1 pericentriolar material 1 protein isoform X13 [Chelonia mydas]